jgi:hypothetical protein
VNSAIRRKKDGVPGVLLGNSDPCSSPNHLRYPNLSCIDNNDLFLMLSKNPGPPLKPATMLSVQPVHGLLMESIIMVSRNTGSPVQSDKEAGTRTKRLRISAAAVWDNRTICMPDTQSAIVRTVVGGVQTSVTRNLVAVHASPLCERSPKVKLLPCDGMTRPLKNSESFHADQ